MRPSPKRAPMSKVLYVASNMTHINNFHTDYIDALRGMGHTVLVMASGEGADFDLPFEKKLFSPKNTACRRMIRKIVKEENFDVIVLNTTLAAFHVRFALLGMRRPRVINIVHGYLFSANTGFVKRNLLLLCERLVSRQTDAIIVMNAEDREIAEKYRLTRGRIDTVEGFGVSVRESVSSPDGLHLEYAPEKYAILFVGELSARKNQAFLIKSMPAVLLEIPNAVLWLVGDGAERDDLVALASEMGVSRQVVFFGKRSDACDFMRAADLYVSAARIEGLPFNIVEALGCGKYVIASQIKGHTDVINSTRVGLLYPENDMNAFVSAVKKAYDEGACGTEAAAERYAHYEKSKVFSDVLQTIVYNFND